MWWNNWFKPATKIGADSPVEQVRVTPLAPPTLVETVRTLMESTDIDALCHDVVLRRYIVVVHWGDISGLFSALLNARKDTPVLTATNLYSYFKSAGIPPSICLSRLCDLLEKTPSPAYAAASDVKELVDELTTLSRLPNALKEPQ